MAAEFCPYRLRVASSERSTRHPVASVLAARGTLRVVRLPARREFHADDVRGSTPPTLSNAGGHPVGAADDECPALVALSGGLLCRAGAGGYRVVGPSHLVPVGQQRGERPRAARRRAAAASFHPASSTILPPARGWRVRCLRHGGCRHRRHLGRDDPGGGWLLVLALAARLVSRRCPGEPAASADDPAVRTWSFPPPLVGLSPADRRGGAAVLEPADRRIDRVWHPTSGPEHRAGTALPAGAVARLGRGTFRPSRTDVRLVADDGPRHRRRGQRPGPVRGAAGPLQHLQPAALPARSRRAALLPCRTGA